MPEAFLSAGGGVTIEDRQNCPNTSQVFLSTGFEKFPKFSGLLRGPQKVDIVKKYPGVT